jgi:DNA protecting protein DprA
MPSFPIHDVSLRALPPELGMIDRPPPKLYWRGHERARTLFERLPLEGLGIVGTRQPQGRSLEMVRLELASLRETPLIILSGLARGIDSAAHLGALEAGLPTVAVLGCGLDQIYPPENQSLAERILAAGGLLLSEIEPGSPIKPHFFLERNRLIAGLSKAVWVVEASHRSGALNTAKWARDYHRDTYATPCFPGDAAFAGNQDLIDCHEARPLWSARNLGPSWGDMSSLDPRKSKRRRAQTTLPLFDPTTLAEQVERLTYAKGGAQVQEILEWALALNWDPQRFFTALQCALSEKLIFDQNGILSALNARFSDQS